MNKSEPIPVETVKRAWEIRRTRYMTMREIAEELGVERTELITAMEEYAKQE